MGFLESLQKIGFGNRGPSGQRVTGAEHFSGAIQQRLGVEKSRGVAQAIASASKDGTPISFSQMSDIAEKWGLPLREVMARVKPINQKLEEDRSSKVLRDAWVMYQKKKKMEPDWKATPQDIERMVMEAGGTMGDMDAFIEGWRKIQGQTKHVVKSPQDQLISIGQTGKAKVEMEATTKPPETLESIESKAAAKQRGIESAKLPPETPEQKLQRSKDLAKFKAGLEAKYKDTPQGRQQKAKDLAKYKAGLKQKDAQSYILPDNTIVQSFDGGRTYRAEDGGEYPLPVGSMKASAQVTGAELSMFKAQKQARDAITPQTEKDKSVKGIAKISTGPYASSAAAFDAIAGGAGLDVLFGKDGFFSDIQEGRQYLRTIKQIGKSALMLSSRGPIWEQKKIDKLFPDPDRFFTNPRTEAKKFKVLRNTLLNEKKFNNQAIINATTPKEVSGLRNSNTEIDRLLALIVDELSPDKGLTSEDEALINKYLK